MRRAQDESTAESVSVEHPAEHEGKSNGGTRCGTRAMRGMFRIAKLWLEARLGQMVPPSHPLETWLIEFSAPPVGEDGKAAGRA